MLTIDNQFQQVQQFPGITARYIDQRFGFFQLDIFCLEYLIGFNGMMQEAHPGRLNPAREYKTCERLSKALFTPGRVFGGGGADGVMMPFSTAPSKHPADIVEAGGWNQ